MKRTEGNPSIAYVESGVKGPPLLLIMGFGMAGKVWAPQVEGLSDDHRLIHFDARGIGESDDSPTPTFTVRAMAADAKRVLDAAGWDSAHIVGISMGGMVAQELALGWPERVRSLSLLATHSGPLHRALPPPTGLHYFIRANLERDPQERVRAIGKILYPPGFLDHVDPEELRTRMRTQLAARAPKRTLLGQLAAVGRHDTRRRLRRIETPTLVVRPGKDTLIRPGNSDRLARLIPGARLLRMDDAGHGLIFQCKDRVNHALREHVARAEASPR